MHALQCQRRPGICSSAAARALHGHSAPALKVIARILVSQRSPTFTVRSSDWLARYLPMGSHAMPLT